MDNHSKVDLILAFAIVCIAVTLTLVVAFATPAESFPASDPPSMLHRD